MHRWKVGSVDLIRVEDDDFVLPGDQPVPAWAVPTLATADGAVGIAFSAIVIVDGARRILVDPWLANDGPRTSPPAVAISHVEDLLTQLADAGVAPDTIDTVINTHWDGDGWNTRPVGQSQPERWAPTFPNARHLWSAAEMDRLHSGSHESSPDALGVLEDAGLIDVVAPGTEVSHHVSVIDAPGHRAGHLAVRIESESILGIIPGHLFLSPLQVDDPTIGADDEPAVATATRRSVLAELADRRALLLTTLMGGPGGGWVSQEADGSYRLDQT